MTQQQCYSTSQEEVEKNILKDIFHFPTNEVATS